jgi:O-antigen/teichoic acid export membrane protein
MTPLASSRRGLVDVRGTGGGIAAQGMAAAASLLLQIVAARSLGAAGYGTFTILVAGLLLLAGLHGGLVGDTRTVLDRSDPVIRDALAACQLTFVVVAMVAAVAGAWASGLTSGLGSLLFGALTAAWLFEDAGRRLLMTRLEFWRLVLNDTIYLAATVAALVLLRLRTGEVTLEILLASMTVGALASVVDAAWAIPTDELRFGRATGEGLRSMARFAVWRSAHAGIRPLATLLLRTIVSALASTAALGRLEVARLAVAPVMILINGWSSVLLPRFSRRHRSSPQGSDPITVTTYLLVGACVAYGAVVTAGADILMPLLTGGDLEVDRWAVAGWCFFAVAFAAGIPVGTSLLARQQSRVVFRLRMLDSAVGLAVAAALVAWLGPGSAPYGLALGATLGAALMWSAAARTQRAAHRPAGTP